MYNVYRKSFFTTTPRGCGGRKEGRKIMSNGVHVSFISLVPPAGQERDLCSAEGQFDEDFQKILNDLKDEHGKSADSKRTVVG